MNSQLKRGTLELCVLSILNGSDCYGYELVNKISECMHVTEGTIYPLMKRRVKAKEFAGTGVHRRSAKKILQDNRIRKA